MRITVIVSVAALVLIAAQGVAAAGPELNERGRGGGDGGSTGRYDFDVSDERPGEKGTATPVADGGERREPTGVFEYPVVATDPTTGDPCTRTRYAISYDAASDGAASAEARARADAYYATIADPSAPPPTCTDAVIDPGAPAREAVATIAGELAPARPYVQPDNRAITGIWSYLTTGIDSNVERAVTVTLFGRDWDVTVQITGTHTIDWGDGTVTEATGDGGPWHPGEPSTDDIAHGYIDTGDFQLTVTTDWTITATLPATGATATDTVRTTSNPVTIDVDEVRSVRDR